MWQTRLKQLLHYSRREPRKLRSLARLYWTTKVRSARQLAVKSSSTPGGARREHDARRPPLVTIHVNRACNLRCKQCWEWGEHGVFKELESAKVKEEMTLIEWVRVLDQLAEWRPYVYFFGGEPFLRKDMPDLIAAASSRGMLTAVNSNMTLITPAVAAQVVAGGLDYVVASLDGPREINDSIRLGKDSYDRTVAGIRNLMAARQEARSLFPQIEVCCTVTQHNQHHLYETAEIAHSLGVDHFKIQHLNFSTPTMQEATDERFERSFGLRPYFGTGFMLHVGSIDTAVLDETERRIRSRKWNFEYGRRPRLSVKGWEPKAHYYSPEIAFGESYCHNPWARAIIQPNGTMVACQGFHDYEIGSLRHQPFDEVWNSEAMGRFRASLENEGLFPYCTRCCDLYELDES